MTAFRKASDSGETAEGGADFVAGEADLASLGALFPTDAGCFLRGPPIVD
jgi:hypothetical protein